MNRLTSNLLRPSRWRYRPLPWVIPATLLATIDGLSPPWLHVCVVATFVVPLAWSYLPRRHMPLLMTSLLLAVVIPGLAPMIRSAAASAELIGDAGGPHETTWMSSIEGFGMERVWTILALLALWWFHYRLQDRRRRRLALRRSLQQRVFRRTQQVRRANRALRNEVIRRQETQHLLDQSESTFQALMERMQLQVSRKNRDGVVTYANEIYCRNLGRDLNEVIGSTDDDLFAPEIAQKYRSDDLRVMDSGQNVDQIEQHPTLDGKTGYAQVFKAPEYDRDGNCVGIQIIFWDVTRKYLGEMALRASEARKRALFDSAADAVVLLDAHGIVVEANPAATILFGDGMVGQRFEDIAMPLTGSIFGSPNFSARNRWAAIPRAARHELTIVRKDESEFESEVAVHTIPVGDEQGCAVIVRDVTLQKRAIETLRSAKAAAEAANRTKTEFMAGVSHELRTPLGGITGLIDLLSKTELTPRGHQYVQMIRQSAQSLSDVIEDILDFAAIEAGRVEIAPRPFDLHDCLNNAFKSLAVRAAEKPLQLILSIQPDTPRDVVGDPKRIRQVLINLIGNAIKFTPLGEVRVRLSLESDPDVAGSRPFFLIEVADTGVGIPTEKQRAVFSAFERGEVGTKRSFGGTGLGLSISDGLVRRMGGRIDLVSQPNVGSCFSCRLPLPIQSSSDPKDNHEDAPHQAQSSPPPLASDATAVIQTGVPNMDSAIEETVDFLGIKRLNLKDTPSLKQNGRITWIVRCSGPTSWQRWVDRTRDDIIWIQVVGVDTPRMGTRREIALNEPVTPDELIETLRFLWDPDDPDGTRRLSPPRLEETTTDRFDLSPAWSEDSTDPVTSAAPTEGHLLLVDDSEVNRLVIRQQLEQAGYAVTTAVDGQAAVGEATAGNFDCILMDLQMPKMDGTEATAEILKYFQKRKRTPPPIIALTAHVTAEHETICQNAGMSGFVTKPVDLSTLVATIRGLTDPDSVPDQESNADQQQSSQVEPPDTSAEDQTTSAAEQPDASQTNHDEGSIDIDTMKQRLMRHSAGSEEIAVSLCDAFLEEVPELLRRVDRHHRQGRFAELTRAAHTLKSCLRYVADDEDVRLAAELEHAAKEEQTTDAEHLDQLREVSQRWIDRVQMLKETLGANAS
ncbi:hybrid sensor histidine kinase/response regulator [Crateriforma conspicua]|uniref:hybrid sensor histidine kinase/response regulator n=1 Tax=Crateriforma conspicua TaxID=2527996 RepID=UPI001189B667|nr:ATP-binding protein [Crateriforma conspicua]QDV61764.1 Signal transduction histidine-protein kinase BarA [Crateriforma conspicua]